jgi:hypothetical protein
MTQLPSNPPGNSNLPAHMPPLLPQSKQQTSFMLGGNEQVIFSKTYKKGLLYRRIASIGTITNQRAIVQNFGDNGNVNTDSISLAETSDILTGNNKRVGNSTHYGGFAGHGYSGGGFAGNTYGVSQFSSQNIGTLLFLVNGAPRLEFYDVPDVRSVCQLARSAKRTLLQGNAQGRINDGLKWLEKPN